MAWNESLPGSASRLWFDPHAHAQQCSDLHQDVVDGDVNELHKVADEPHDGKPHCCCQGDLLELCRDISDCSGKAHTHSLVCNETCNSLQKHWL